MNLSRSILKDINPNVVKAPNEELFDLPEKVLQFGTGVLLRGLPDYFIDKANQEGIFNGRVVVVKSTSQGDTNAFEEQDGLYTICVRGIENGQAVEENRISAAISRVLSAKEQWPEILAYAGNEALQIIISNTTEVGIQLVQEKITQQPPASFPGKLLAFLYERFKAFNGSSESGMAIIPTELLPDNGKKLKAIVIALARYNQLEDSFIEWLEQHNYFCSSLVDRIVPGKPEGDILNSIEERLGYTDQLLLMSEVYRLWAIEGNEQVKNILSFADADAGVIIAPDIDLYRELKLRLLNGTHTLSCGLAFLAQYDTVKEVMEDAAMSGFISDLLFKELAQAIPYKVAAETALEFGAKVLDRFRNPFLKHHWISITMQYSSKMKMRVIPLLLQHYKMYQSPPELLTLGFVAYLFFTKPVKKRGDKFYGELDGKEYSIQDDQASVFMERWNTLPPAEFVKAVLADVPFWGEDLTLLPHFYEAVLNKLNQIIELGAKAMLQQLQVEKEPD